VPVLCNVFAWLYHTACVQLQQSSCFLHQLQHRSSKSRMQVSWYSVYLTCLSRGRTQSLLMALNFKYVLWCLQHIWGFVCFMSASVKWDIPYIRKFSCYIFVLCNFCHWKYWQKLNTLKCTKHITLLQLPQKMLCCYSYTMLTSNARQLQTAEWACAYLQARFEFSSAFTNRFSRCFGRYVRR